MEQAVKSVAVQGRVAVVGIGDQPARLWLYEQIINKEAEIVGVSDHLAQEIPRLLQFVREGKLRLGDVVTRTVPLAAQPINETLDALERGDGTLRVVIKP